MKIFFASVIVIIASCNTNWGGNQQVFEGSNIPQGAFFVKGSRDGYWVQADAHAHMNNVFIKLYDGSNGRLVFAKRFSVICRLEGNPLWLDDVKKQILYFDGAKFRLVRPDGQDSCWLQSN